MQCKVCGKSIGMVFSRQIYLERLPIQNFCVECFDALMIEYDKLIERMRKCTTKDQTKNESGSINAISS